MHHDITNCIQNDKEFRHWTIIQSVDMTTNFSCFTDQIDIDVYFPINVLAGGGYGTISALNQNFILYIISSLSFSSIQG